MPIVNIQLGGEGELPDGSKVSLPPQAVLSQRGPVVQATVSVGQQIAAQVLQDGGELPQPVSGLALIDSGATGTCVDEEAAQQLKLPVIDVVKISSASHSEVEQNVYPIQIEVDTRGDASYQIRYGKWTPLSRQPFRDLRWKVLFFLSSTCLPA